MLNRREEWLKENKGMVDKYDVNMEAEQDKLKKTMSIRSTAVSTDSNEYFEPKETGTAW